MIDSTCFPLANIKIEFGFSQQLSDVIGNYVGFLVLQQYSVGNSDKLQVFSKDELMVEKYPAVVHLAKAFLSQEVVSAVIETYNLDSFQLFRLGLKNGDQHRKDLMRMIVQHNIRVISKYYSRISLTRVSQLLQVDRDYCEEQLCTLNVNQHIKCRVDRIDDVIGMWVGNGIQ